MKINAIVLAPLFYCQTAAFAPLGVVHRTNVAVAMSSYDAAYRAAIDRGAAASSSAQGFDPAYRGATAGPGAHPTPSSGTFEGKSVTASQDAVQLGSISERLTNIEKRLMEVTHAIEEQSKFQRITFALTALSGQGHNVQQMQGPNVQQMRASSMNGQGPSMQQMRVNSVNAYDGMNGQGPSMQQMRVNSVNAYDGMNGQGHNTQHLRVNSVSAFELKEILCSFLVSKGHYIHPDPGVRMRIVDELESLLGLRPRLTEEEGGWVVWYK